MEYRIQIPELYNKQLEIKNDKAKTKVICAGRQVGKSTLLRDVAFTAMLEAKSVVYITPTFFLADEMYDKILNVFPEKVIKSANKSSRRIKIKNGGEVMFVSGQALNVARGFTKIDICLVDEAAHIADLEKELGSSILPLLLANNGDLWLVSTPNGRNYFYKMYADGLEGINGIKSWQFTSFDNPYISKQALENLMSLMTEAQINEEIYAIPSESSYGAIRPEVIRNATLPQLSTLPPVIYGIDVAFQGNDRFVIVGLDANGDMCHFEAYLKQPIEILEARILALPSNVTKYIDATGNGWVFYDRLSRTCQNINPHIWTAQNKPVMMSELIMDIEQGKVKVNEETANELYVYQYKKLPNGTQTFQSQSGFRDDCIAALALANHYKNEALSYQDWKLYIS